MRKLQITLMKLNNEESLREMSLYLVFGVATTLVSIVTYYFCLLLLELNYQVSNVLSWVLSVLFAYITSRIIVFKAKKLIRAVVLFWGARIVTLGIETGLLFILVKQLSIDPSLAKPFILFVTIVLNYLLSKFVVFRKSRNRDVTDR